MMTRPSKHRVAIAFTATNYDGGAYVPREVGKGGRAPSDTPRLAEFRPPGPWETWRDLGAPEVHPGQVPHAPPATGQLPGDRSVRQVQSGEVGHVGPRLWQAPRN
jgi:hypothetical protein